MSFWNLRSRRQIDDEQCLRCMLAAFVGMNTTGQSGSEFVGDELGIRIDFLNDPVGVIQLNLWDLLRRRSHQAGSV